MDEHELATPRLRDEVLVSLWKGRMEIKADRLKMGDIAYEIADLYGISVADLKGQSRQRRYAWPRQHAMWIMSHQKHLSLTQIGRFLGDRDHTTILHGIRAYAARLAETVEAAA